MFNLSKAQKSKIAALHANFDFSCTSRGWEARYKSGVVIETFAKFAELEAWMDKRISYMTQNIKEMT